LRIFDAILEGIRAFPDGKVSDIVLGWYGSVVVLKDGRYGLGSVPSSKYVETFEASFLQIRRLLQLSAQGLAELLVSPYPQEFAIASAAASALAPVKAQGIPLQKFLESLDSKKLYIVGYERPLVLLFNKLNLNPYVLDDMSRKPGVLPSWVGPHLLNDADWLWITCQALRDRQMLSLEKLMKNTKKVVLLGPGIPWLPDVLRAIGINFVAQPRPLHDKAGDVFNYIAAGGNYWDHELFSWEVHQL